MNTVSNPPSPSFSKLIIASSNSHKVAEIKKAFLTKNRFSNLEVVGYQHPIEVVEDGETFYDNALLKAEWCYRMCSQSSFAVVGDDSGLVVPALNGEPGVYSARYAGEEASDQENNQKLINQLKKIDALPTPAYFTTTLVCVFRVGDKFVTLSGNGVCRGVIIEEPRGENGFGYDPYFVPETGSDKTFSEMTMEEKNKLSHRSRALVDLLAQF